jgi:hypothetical protein
MLLPVVVLAGMKLMSLKTPSGAVPALASNMASMCWSRPRGSDVQALADQCLQSVLGKRLAPLVCLVPSPLRSKGKEAATATAKFGGKPGGQQLFGGAPGFLFAM